MVYSSNKRWNKVISMAILSVICGIYIEFYIEARIFFFSGSYVGLLNNEISSKVFLRTVLASLLFGVLFYLIWHFRSSLKHIEKNRYVIGLIIILLLTILKISGSSISVWDTYLGHSFQTEEDLQAAGVLFGIPRAVRGDEWNVFTPLNFSQAYNNYSSISDIVRGGGTDVVTTYGVASYSLVTVFRPFLWGYLFFDNARGLAFYWTARLVFLILASYELGKLITKNNKYVSAAFAALISFSQAMQWWFSINAEVEMLIFGSYAVVLLNKLVHVENVCYKILICIGIIECAGGFVFTYYPALEIPFLYVFFVIFLWNAWDNKKLIRKKDILLIILSGIVFVLMSGAIIWNSREVFSALMNTAYPGARVSTGGDGDLKTLFYWILTPFLSVDESRSAGVSYAPEIATFYSLFPLGIIWSLWIIVRKKRDNLLVFLVFLEIIFGVFYFIGIPEVIAKLTLLSNVPVNRLRIVFDYVGILLLIRCLSIHQSYNEERISNKKKVFYIGVSVFIVCFSCVCVKELNIVTSRCIWAMALVIAFCSIIGMLFCNKENVKTISLYLLLISFVTGIFVNPVQYGTDVIYKSDLAKEISEIVKENPDAKWISTSRTYGDFLIMNGASTVNSVNVYPNLSLWEKIDEDKTYIDIYNRYAHIDIPIVDSETSFELVYLDWFKINLNYKDISKLGVQYILSIEKYDYPNLKRVSEIDGIYIYEVQE